MREIFYMTKRNCLIYFRDKSTVFYSVFSTIIVLALMVVFLGRMNSEDLVNLLAKYGGERDTALDEKNAAYLIQLWTLAGILMVNSVTVPLTMLSAMVRDETGKRIMAFYVTPVKRIRLALGYVFSAWLVGMVMCILTLALGELYFGLQGERLLTLPDILQLTGMIALNAFTISAIGYLLALFVHSDGGWNGLLTVIGTLVGFAGGIYLPVSALSVRLQNILKCLPVLHGASMMRRVCTEQAIAETFRGLPDMAGEIFREKMGITLFRGESEILLWEQVLLLLLYAIIAIVIAASVNRKRKLKDR